MLAWFCAVAPVDQVMAESKAREQKGNVDGVNLGDQDRDAKIAVVSLSGADKQVETPQGSEDGEIHGNGQETPQGMLWTQRQHDTKEVNIQANMVLE